MRRRVAAILGLVLSVVLGATWGHPASGAQSETNGGPVSRRDSQEPAAPPPGGVEGEPFVGEPGVTETIAEIMDRDARLPRAPFVPREKKEREVPFEKVEDPLSPEVASWPPPPALALESPAPRAQSPKLPQTIGTSFLGMQGPGVDSPYVPPARVGAGAPSPAVVGPNGRIRVFDKTGALGVLNTSMENFFSSVAGGSRVSDPHIRYDRLSGRWFVVIITVDTCPNKVLMAVSSGPTITGGTSFTFFSFTPEATFIDYPTLGVDRNALYIGGNVFNCAGNALLGVSAYVVRKADLLGGSAFVTIFRGLESAGIWTPQGVDNDDPGATVGYFIGVDFNLFGRLGIRRVMSPGGTPTLSAQLNVTVPTTAMPMPQPQPVPGPALDPVDDRLFAAAIHRNKITGTLTLWTAHNIKVDASGVGSSFGDRNGSRWYEIGSLTGTPTLVQAGTLFDRAAATPFGYWIPSVMMSGQGHVALAASRASAAAVVGYAGISAAGRFRTDAAGSIRAPTLAQGSSSPYDTFVSGTERWGDFSQTVVDPNDDQTMWTFQEYASATNTWGVRAIQLRSPAPATPATASPSSVPPGQASITVVVTGTSVGGSEFFDPGADAGGPGFARHIAATVSGGVTVNSVTFDTPTQVSLNISTVGASLGTKNVTVTNPDGQTATGTGILTVSSACGTITVNPSSIPAVTAGSAYSQAFTQTGGSGTITWSSTGALPTGLSLDASTGVVSGIPIDVGSFTFTIIVTDSNFCAGSRTVTLVVNPDGFLPIALAVDSAGNSVLEAGETVVVAPSWRNTTGTPTSVTGAASTFTGPGSPEPIYTVADETANYGLVPDATTVGCATATGNCYSLGLSVPTVRPVRHWDATFLETLSGGDRKTWTLHVGGSFDDVSPTSGFYPFIETLFHKSVTAGCAATRYCPSSPALREQMAVFVLRAKEGAGYAPPSCGSTTTFNDVPASSPFCRWIEELARRGAVVGCGGGAYCPDEEVTREQMAVFVLRTLDPTLVPPACTTPIFNDVPASSAYCPWVEELYRRGIVAGCGGGNYCPTSPVTREQMGVFLSTTFGLTLYGP
jgi:hypothetical protein